MVILSYIAGLRPAWAMWGCLRETRYSLSWWVLGVAPFRTPFPAVSEAILNIGSFEGYVLSGEFAVWRQPRAGKNGSPIPQPGTPKPKLMVGQ